MLKIRSFKLQRIISGAGCSRFFACKHCPIFECKQPEEPNEYEEAVKRMIETSMPSVCREQPPTNSNLYKKIFMFVCIPALLLSFVNVYFFTEKEKRIKFIPYTHLRIRNTKYPWHPVRTLFHNPVKNALPTGYEVEVPEDEEYDGWCLAPYFSFYPYEK